MRPLVACLLLVLFGTASCSDGTADKSKRSTPTYEPQFKKEGTLAFLNAEKDTMRPLLDIELAITDEEVQYGMMYRKSIPKNTGMLFIREREERQSFWMHNTYVSLDIIYIASDSSIVSMAENAIPLSDIGLPSKGPAQYVLEVAAGFCAKHSIEEGHFVRFSILSD